MLRLCRPSPAMAVALVALFVGLTGTAVGAMQIVPLAKKALYANKAGTAKKASLAANASRLEGKTAAEVAALAGPASSVAGLVTVKSAPFNIAAAPGLTTASVACDSGSKAIGGGFSTAAAAIILGGSTTISADGGTYSMVLANFGGPAATGNIWTVCVK